MHEKKREGSVESGAPSLKAQTGWLPDARHNGGGRCLFQFTPTRRRQSQKRSRESTQYLAKRQRLGCVNPSNTVYSYRIAFGFGASSLV